MSKALNIRLNESLYDTLAVRAEAQAASVTEVVRLALDVTACNRNRPGLQSACFWDRITCIYRPGQDHIICI